MKELSREVRRDFPILEKKIRGLPLCYLDSAATALKPRRVAERLQYFYQNETANIHRGAHTLSHQGTELYEQAREEIARFLQARSAQEIVFTKGTTEGINLIADSLSETPWNEGEVVAVTRLEHHSNFLPWQRLAREKRARFEIIEVTQQGDIDLSDFQRVMKLKPKVLAMTACSNAIGTLVPLASLVADAKAAGAIVVIDAAQLVPHLSINVQSIGCDFLVFSGHKLFGPFGVGVLFGRKESLAQLPPYQLGGGMISTVGDSESTWADVPTRFEAGTPNIEGVLGLHAAIKYIDSIGWDRISEAEHELIHYAFDELAKIDGLRIIGHPEKRSAIIPFLIEGTHHSDVAELLDQQGVAVRAGHLCCQPLMRKLGTTGLVRASFSLYNGPEDVDRLVKGIQRAKELLK